MVYDAKVKVTQSCPTLCNPIDCSPARLLCPWDFPGKNTGVGGHSLLQGIFQTQGLNRGLLHCRWIFHYLSHLKLSPTWNPVYMGGGGSLRVTGVRDLGIRELLGSVSALSVLGFLRLPYPHPATLYCKEGRPHGKPGNRQTSPSDRPALLLSCLPDLPSPTPETPRRIFSEERSKHFCGGGHSSVGITSTGTWFPDSRLVRAGWDKGP